MKKSKIVSLLLVTMMVLAMLPSGAVFANDFTVISTSPADETGAVSVLEDLTIEFSSEVDSSTINADNVIISGGNASFTVSMQSDTVAVLEFENALEFATTYTIELTSNITDTQQTPLTSIEVSFTTELNPITVIFQEDFNGNPAEALARFEQVGQMDPVGESYGIANNALKITAASQHMNPVPDGYPAQNWESRPMLMIIGSENWADYEVEYDVNVSSARGYPTVAVRFQDYHNYYRNYHRAETVGTNGDGIFLSRIVSNASTSLTTGIAGDLFNRGTYYHAKFSAIGSAFAFESETKDGIKAISGSDSTWASGGIAFSNMRYDVLYDNIVVYDRGFIFTPSLLKNTQDVITLNFNEAIDFNTVDGNISVSDSNGPVNFELYPNGLNGVDVQIVDMQFGTFYSITVGDGITNSLGTKSLLNEKSFDIKTAQSVNTFAVESRYPENGATNVSILEDATISFTNSVDKSTLTTSNISVSGNPTFSILSKSASSVTLSFDDGLDFNTTYTIQLTSDVRDVHGNPLPETTFYFATEKDTFNVLFAEDFNGDPVEALARFEQVGQMDPTGESYGIANNALRITAAAFHIDPVPAGYPSGNWESRPMIMIIGSENWTDYEVEYDVNVNADRGYPTVAVRFQDYHNYYRNYHRLDTVQNGGDGMFLSRISDNASTSLATGITGDLFNRRTYYHAKFSAIGSEFAFESETKDGIKTVYGTDSTWASGGIAFSNMRYEVLYDNIVVYDRGFMFEPAKIKNIREAITLNFNADVDFNTIQGNITVSNEYGAVDTIITANGSRGVNIAIVDPQPDTMYTVDVSKNIKRADGQAMTMDKTFKIKTELATVTNINIKSGGQIINSLTGGSSINATADACYYLSTGEQEYTLILAVYDNNGYLYDISFEQETLTVGDVDPVPLTTPSITLPGNVAGFKARAFVWDNIVNIKPLSSVKQVQ